MEITLAPNSRLTLLDFTSIAPACYNCIALIQILVLFLNIAHWPKAL